VSVRFATNLLLALAGGFVVVESVAFASSVVGWVTLGVAIGILLVVAAAQLERVRGLPQRGLDAVVALLGCWTVIASVVFTGTALAWLSFAEGCGFVALAVVGLVLHELKTERVVHSFKIEDARRPAEQYQRAVA
jgi:Trk-type K+ transport system membrane component